MHKLASVLLAVFLAGCATVGVEKVEQLKTGTTIAPLSLMGPTLAMRHVGTIVFQNERRDMDVAQWDIDKFTETSAARIIREGGRFKAVLVDMGEARKKTGKLETSFWTSGAVLQGGAEGVTKLARDSGADYVLVLGPAQLGDPFMGTNQSLSGYGIYQRSMFGLKRSINYLTMRMVLLDGKTGAEVARTHSHSSSPRTNENWMDSDKLVLTGTNTTSTKAAIEQLIDGVLKKGLPELKLAR